MDQVCSSTEILFQFIVMGNSFKGLVGSPIPILADESINLLVFTERVYSRCKNDQLPTISYSHARPVYTLVSQPGGTEFAGIEVDHHLVQWTVDHGEVRSEEHTSELQ